eukprot:2022088-Rhodomonas_salina.1
MDARTEGMYRAGSLVSCSARTAGRPFRARACNCGRWPYQPPPSSSLPPPPRWIVLAPLPQLCVPVSCESPSAAPSIAQP